MNKKRHYPGGFTFIEAMVVVGIMGILLVMAYPNIKNTLETRALENNAREVLSSLQQAKFMAVKLKLFHRLRFDNSAGYWVYYLERETDPGTWEEVPNFFRRTISQKYSVSVNFLNQMVVFSPLGTVEYYNERYLVSDPSVTLQNISIQDPNLLRHGQPSTRRISVFAGGSVQYVKLT
jgi:prepilin-type N-terminal cleavage/methylation domain-containing protein